MQCKDIPDAAILGFVWDRNNAGDWCNWYFGDENDIVHAMPAEAQPKLRWAKMNQLIKRGLVMGCNCGCRGDYVLTDKGCGFIDKPRHRRFVGDVPV